MFSEFQTGFLQQLHKQASCAIPPTRANQTLLLHLSICLLQMCILRETKMVNTKDHSRQFVTRELNQRTMWKIELLT